jgi:hypothetical protein
MTANPPMQWLNSSNKGSMVVPVDVVPLVVFALKPTNKNCFYFLVCCTRHRQDDNGFVYDDDFMVGVFL